MYPLSPNVCQEVFYNRQSIVPLKFSCARVHLFPAAKVSMLDHTLHKSVKCILRCLSFEMLFDVILSPLKYIPNGHPARGLRTRIIKIILILFQRPKDNIGSYFIIFLLLLLWSFLLLLLLDLLFFDQELNFEKFLLKFFFFKFEFFETFFFESHCLIYLSLFSLSLFKRKNKEKKYFLELDYNEFS